ncbi:hypothetical protein CBL_05426 [Carabus blaptoides fortunei]
MEIKNNGNGAGELEHKTSEHPHASHICNPSNTGELLLELQPSTTVTASKRAIEVIVNVAGLQYEGVWWEDRKRRIPGQWDERWVRSRWPTRIVEQRDLRHEFEVSR